MDTELQLGDIIQIKAPNKPELDGRTFYVKSLRNTVRLIDTATFAEVSYTYDIFFMKGDIAEINVVSPVKEDELGFARQNGLLPTAKIYIKLAADYVVYGTVTALEEDMITVELDAAAGGGFIQIDFEYDGIPPEILDVGLGAAAATAAAAATDSSGSEDIDFGDDLDNILQIVDVEHGRERYKLEAQLSELADQLLAEIPRSARNRAAMLEISRVLERFKVLRKKYSIFGNGAASAVVMDILRRGDDYKPLAAAGVPATPWFLPVANMRRIGYLNGKDDEEINLETREDSFARTYNQIDFLIKQIEAENGAYYENKNCQDFLSKYRDLLRTLQQYSEVFDTVGGEPVTAPIEAIVSYGEGAGKYSSWFSITQPEQHNVTARFAAAGFTELAPIIVEDALKKSRHPVYERRQVTPADAIVWNKFISLPFPVVLFSRVHGGAANLAEKVPLAEQYFQRWRLFQKAYPRVEDAGERSAAGITNGMVEFSRDPAVFPTTQRLLELVRQNAAAFPAPRAISAAEIVRWLEPYGIYLEHIHNIQRPIIDDILGGLLRAHEDTARNWETAILPLVRAGAALETPVPPLYKELLSGFGVPAGRTAAEEIMATVTAYDFGDLFYNVFSQKNIMLYSAQNIMTTFESKDIINNEMCPLRKLVKRYFSKEDVIADVNQLVFVAAEFDTTPYDLLQKHESDAAPMAEIVEELVRDYKYRPEQAREIAEYIMVGRRPVKDGEYAILMPAAGDPSPAEYYYRDGMTWVADTTVDDFSFINGSSMGCLHEPARRRAGADAAAMRKQIKATLIKRMLAEFDAQIPAAREEMAEILRARAEDLKERFLFMRRQANRHFAVAEQLATLLGAAVATAPTVRSPHTVERDAILAADVLDLGEKYTNILGFIEAHTRAPLHGEDSGWLYCLDTDTPLLPVFYKRLAHAYIYNRTQYDFAIKQVCAEYGKLSDDGDNIVDKNSGYVIVPRKMVAGWVAAPTEEDAGEEDEPDRDAEETKIAAEPEGEDDPDAVAEAAAPPAEEFEDEIELQIDANTIHRNFTTAGPEIALNSELVAAIKKEKFKLPPNNSEAHYAFNVFKDLCMQMYIPREKDLDTFFLSHITDCLARITKEDAYKKKNASTAAAGEPKKMSYETFRAQFVVGIVAGLLLVSVQLSGISRRVRKSFPQCVRTFEGYPLIESDKEEHRGINYVACVIHKLKSAGNPLWNAFKGKKPDKIGDVIFNSLSLIIVKRPEIAAQLERARRRAPVAAAAAAAAGEIPAELNVCRWTHFLPPLIATNVRHVQPVTGGILKEFVENIRAGRKQQDEYYHVLRAKIAQYSFGLYSAVNEVVAGRDPILKSAAFVPFLENACCAGGAAGRTIDYFIEERAELREYLEQTSDLANKVADYNTLSRTTLLSRRRRAPPPAAAAPAQNRERIIYETFIKYWAARKIVGAAAFPRAPEGEDIWTELSRPELAALGTIEEKISFLKSRGIVLREEDLQKFIRRVNYMNRRRIMPPADEPAQPDLPAATDAAAQIFNAIIKGSTIPAEVLGEMNVMLENFLIETLEAPAPVADFIRAADHWKTAEIMKNNQDFYKHAIAYLSSDLPNQLRDHATDFVAKVPIYWDVSDKHRDDIRAMMTNYNEKNAYQFNTNFNIRLAGMKNIGGELRTRLEYIKKVNLYKYPVGSRPAIYKFILLYVAAKWIEISKAGPAVHESAAARAARAEEEEVDTAENEIRQGVRGILVSYFHYLAENKATIDKDYGTIWEQVQLLRQQEKTRMIARFDKLAGSEQERRVENMKMQFRMGDYSVAERIDLYSKAGYDAGI